MKHGFATLAKDGMASPAVSLAVACLIAVSSQFTEVKAKSFRAQPLTKHAAVVLAQGNSSNASRQPEKAMESTAPAPAPSKVPESIEADEDAVFKVVEKTSLTSEGTTKCLCEMGEFWHWRIAKCIKQGPFGYECGFFPKEHWHRVCEDGYKCEALEGVPDNYVSHGKYEGTAGSAPASCRECKDSDKCEVGQKRHEEECLKKYIVSGEASATVRVTLPVTTNGETKDVTVEETASVSVDEAYKAVNLEPGQKVGAVLSAKIVAKGDELAFKKASEAALAAAKAKGLLDADAAAKAVEEAEAAEATELEEEALDKEAEGWKEEAGDNKEAQDAADSRAKDMAKEKEKLEAEKDAHREAQKNLMDVLRPERPANTTVPRQVKVEVKQYRKITVEQRKEMRP